MEEEKTLLCLGSFNECHLVTKAQVFSVSEECFTLRSLRADSTLTFSFGSEGTIFEYAEPRQFGIAELTPELEQLSSIGIAFPVRTSTGHQAGICERESLVLLEMWDADRSEQNPGE